MDLKQVIHLIEDYMSNEILQGSVKIAEFMGGRLHKTGGHSYCQHVPILDGKQFGLFHVTDLQYHSSWDWLMPVVEKIRAMKFVVLLGNKSCVISQEYMNTKFELSPSRAETSIEATFKAIVQFIDWYNLNVTPS